MNPKQDVALVLSGGGARGMAHIGVIETLLKHNYRITSIAGTSIGSLIGAVYICEKLPGFKKWVNSTGKWDVIRLMDFAVSKAGFIKGEKVFRQIQKYVTDTDIEKLSIPYAAVAVDIKNHKEVIFRSGNLIHAIRASVSVPTVLRTTHFNGVELVDGGVLNPLPLDVVVRKPGDILVAVDLNADIRYKKPSGYKQEKNQNTTYEKTLEYINEKWSAYFKNDKPRSSGYFDLVTNTIYAMQMKLTQSAIEKSPPDVLVNISRTACDIFEFHRAGELIEYGREQAERVLKRL